MSDTEREGPGLPQPSSGAVAAGTIDAPADPAPATGGPPPQDWPLPRRLAGAGLVAAAGLLLFVCYLRMSSTVPSNSDGASNALQAWDMLHGNLLLRGWHLSDVSFYTTELPEYMLVEAVHGLGAGVVHAGAALTYTLLVLLAAALAKGRATGVEAWTRMLLAGGLLLAPQLGVGTQVLILSPDHVGTAVPVLVTWLLLDRAGRRRWVPPVVGLLLAWTLAADAIVLYIGIFPLLAVSLARAYRQVMPSQPGGATPRNPPQSGRPISHAWFELSLAAAALAATVAGLKLPGVIHALGGYSVTPAPQSFALVTQMPTRVWQVLGGVLLLFGADFFGLRLSFGTGLVLLHLAGVALAAWGVCAGVRRFLRDNDLVVQLLVVGAITVVAAYLFARGGGQVGYSHEMAPALPFAAVLAGRLLAGRLICARLLPVAAVVLLGYALTLAGNAAQRPAPDADPGLTSFLAAHHLRYGLSGYWQADEITLATGGAIAVRDVQVNPHGLAPGLWESQESWYDPRLHDANFVLLFAGRPGFLGEAGLTPFSAAAQIADSFGRPAVAYRVGRYTVLVWRQNLLRRLQA